MIFFQNIFLMFTAFHMTAYVVSATGGDFEVTHTNSAVHVLCALLARHNERPFICIHFTVIYCPFLFFFFVSPPIVSVDFFFLEDIVHNRNHSSQRINRFQDGVHTRVRMAELD